VRVPLDSTYVFTAEAESYPLLPGLQAADAGAPDYVLEPFDHVLVLRQPEFELQRTVVVIGEVSLPGRYALRTKTERLSDLMARVGGITSSGYGAGARLIRAEGGAGLVDIDMEDAIRNPRGPSDMVLLPGDTIIVPEYNPIVIVEGAVVSPTAVRFRPGEDLDYYISAAGGFTSHADEDRVSVRYASGEIRTKNENFLWFDWEPAPGPGSTVRVPVEDPDERVDWSEVIGDVAQVSATLATLIVVLIRLN
jgi:polysaccharide biosynthesis/export protein